MLLSIVLLLGFSGETINTEISNPVKTASETSPVQNPFFFNSGTTRVQYEGRYILYDVIEQPFFLNIIHLENFKNGTLYVLLLDRLRVSDPMDQLPAGRQNLGYFYVTKDKIYKMSDYETFSAAKHTEVINSISKNEKDFIKKCQLVCQDKATADKPDKDGWHEYIEVEGDKRRFRQYNDGGGSTWYERIVWQKGKGIIFYRSGYGSGREEAAFGLNLNDD